MSQTIARISSSGSFPCTFKSILTSTVLQGPEKRAWLVTQLSGPWNSTRSLSTSKSVQVGATPNTQKWIQQALTRVNTKRRSLPSSQKSPPPPPAPPTTEETNGLVVLEIMAGACLGLYVIPQYVMDVTACEGPSMMPTIQPMGDILWYEKVSHRLLGFEGGDNAVDRRNSSLRQGSLKSESDWTWLKLAQRVSSPLQHGDVVIVKHPLREGQTICKRIRALPGDKVWVYGQVRPTIIPDGHVWLEGDNPRNSTDSRDYGPVPGALILGRALLRVWPLRGQALMERERTCLTTPKMFSWESTDEEYLQLASKVVHAGQYPSRTRRKK